VQAGEFGKARPCRDPVWLSSKTEGKVTLVSEYQAKQDLSVFGLNCPKAMRVQAKSAVVEMSAKSMPFPLVLKGLGVAHKSEVGAVIINIENVDALKEAVKVLPPSPDGYLVEQMIQGAVLELIVGVSKDDSGMLLLTLGAGGVLTELIKDSVSLVMPVSRKDIRRGLATLKISRLLDGYRGAKAVNKDKIVSAVIALQEYVQANLLAIEEIDINPLIVCTDDVYAVDALIRLQTDNS
jgi:succinyl-CoA synthetase beta subunit